MKDLNEIENTIADQNKLLAETQEKNKSETEIEGDKELVLPIGWKVVFGDLKKLELDNNEFIVIEKDVKIDKDVKNEKELKVENESVSKIELSIENDSASKNEILPHEITTKSLDEDLKVLRIVLKKYRVGYYDHEQAKHINTDDYKYGLWLFFGKPGELNLELPAGMYNYDYPTNFSYMYYEKYFDENQASCISSLCNLPNILNDVSYPLNPVPKNFSDILWRTGAIKTQKYADFDIEWMSPSLFEHILNTLEENEFITEEEAAFILKLAPTKKISFEEKRLISKIQTALNEFQKDPSKTSELDNAVKWSHEIHALNLEHSKKRLTGITHTNKKGRIYLDDSRAALDLALALEASAPEYAVKALELFHGYNAEELAESLYLKEALKKLSDIQLSLCGSASKDQNDPENREIRKKAITHFLFSDTEELEMQERIEKQDKLFKLFELQCGGNPFKSDQSIFKDLNLDANKESYALELLFGMMFKMSDEILSLRKKLGLINVESSNNASTQSSEFTQSESTKNDGTSKKDDSSKNKKSSPKPLTFTKQQGNSLSLEDDDFVEASNDDDSVINSKRKKEKSKI